MLDQVTVALERRPNVDRVNRGFVLDQIVAIIDGVQVGSLKIEYVPENLYRRFYPGVLNFMAQIKGSNVLPLDERAMPWRKLSREGLIKILCYNGYGVPGDARDFANYTDAKLRDMVAAYEQKLLAGKEGREFREFFSFHVDKPFVAYIEVNEEFRGRGIGTALYFEGARWMREKGMVFRSSRMQSDEAKIVWDKFKERGLTRADQFGRLMLYPEGS